MLVTSGGISDCELNWLPPTRKPIRVTRPTSPTTTTTPASSTVPSTGMKKILMHIFRVKNNY